KLAGGQSVARPILRARESGTRQIEVISSEKHFSIDISSVNVLAFRRGILAQFDVRKVSLW
ncbi:MAG: hypothetical protein ABSG00_06445, partial [Terracidiphilus sp.]